jgi:hypothetical protein
MRELTRILVEGGEESPVGLLGGEYGYGVEHANETFEMHPFYWGECTCGFDEVDAQWAQTHQHASTCYQEELARRGVGYDPDTWEELNPDLSHDQQRAIAQELARERGLDPEVGLLVHCDCGLEEEYRAWRTTHDHDEACPTVRPNFRHHGSGFELRWYKYIGRSMEINEEISPARFREILQECVQSLQQEGQPA